MERKYNYLLVVGGRQFADYALKYSETYLNDYTIFRNFHFAKSTVDNIMAQAIREGFELDDRREYKGTEHYRLEIELSKEDKPGFHIIKTIELILVESF